MKRSQAYVSAGVAVAVLLAMWTRLQFIELYGGNDPTYLEWARAEYFGGLSEFYLASANNIAAGNGYRDTVYPPGYAIVLAGFEQLGCGTPSCLRIAQAALDSAAIIPLALMAAWSGLGPASVILAACAYALHPLWAAGSTFLLADSLLPALMIVNLAALLWAPRGGRLARWIVPGAIAGLSLLVRPDLSLLVILAVAWCLWVCPSPRRWRAASLIVAALVVSTFPWGLHNRMTHGVWMFTSSGGGSGLWQGLGTLPNEYGYIVSDSAAAARVRSAGFEFLSIEGDAYLKREYLRAVREHPGHVARVILDRWYGILTTSERLQPLFFGRLRQWIDVTGALACVAALMIARRNPARMLLIGAPPLYALMSVGIVYFEPRYIRYTHLGYLFAFLTLGTLVADRVRQQSPRIAVAIATLAAAVIAIYAVRELRTLALLS